MAPANYNLAAGETAHLLESNRPKVYLYDAEVRQMACKALELSSYRPEHIIMVDALGTAGQPPAGHILFSSYLTGRPQTPVTPGVHAAHLRRGHAAVHLRHHRAPQRRPPQPCD